MEFIIDITKQDYRHFSVFVTEKLTKEIGKRWWVKLFHLVNLICFLLFILEIYSVYLTDLGPEKESLRIAIIAFVLWFVGCVLWQRISAKLMISASTLSKGATLGPRTVVLSETGAKMVSDVFVCEANWKGIVSIDQDKHNLYLFIDAVQALILPFVNASLKLTHLSTLSPK